MSFYTGKDSSNNNVLHITAGTTDLMSIKSGPLPTTAFHSDLKNLYVDEIISWVYDHSTATYDIYYPASVLPTFDSAMLINVATFSNGSILSAVKASLVKDVAAGTFYCLYGGTQMSVNKTATGVFDGTLTSIETYVLGSSIDSSSDVTLLESLKVGDDVNITNDNITIGNIGILDKSYIVLPSTYSSDFEKIIPFKKAFSDTAAAYDVYCAFFNGITETLYDPSTEIYIGFTKVATTGLSISADSVSTNINVNETTVLSSLYDYSSVSIKKNYESTINFTVPKSSTVNLNTISIPWYPPNRKMLLSYYVEAYTPGLGTMKRVNFCFLFDATATTSNKILASAITADAYFQLYYVFKVYFQYIDTNTVSFSIQGNSIDDLTNCKFHISLYELF